MLSIRLGLVAPDASVLDRVRDEDGVDLLLLRSTLLDMPRAGAARTIRERVERQHPDITLVPYAWHLVTHGKDDVLGQRGTRRLPGDPHAFGHMADTAEVEEAWAATMRGAQALGSTTVVLRTPPGFAPGARGRLRLEAFCGKRRSEGTELVWEPEGLWQPEELTAAATQFGLTVLAPPPARGSLVLTRRWLCPGAAGSAADLRGRLGESLVLQILEADETNMVTVVFAGPLALPNLRAFRRVWLAALG